MGHRETGRKEMGRKTSGFKERGVGETVAKEMGGRRRELRLLFLTTYSDKPTTIYKARMDGSESTKIVAAPSTGTSFKLAIDYNNNMICWTSYHERHIVCSDYDGNQTDIYYNTTGNPRAIEIEDDTVYYTQYNSNSKTFSVNSFKLNGGKHRTILELEKTPSIALLRRECVKVSGTLDQSYNWMSDTMLEHQHEKQPTHAREQSRRLKERKKFQSSWGEDKEKIPMRETTGQTT
ncbi:hypothetical protein LSAT2_018950 [Lamellibrachia satsuma]|nr:hypothetical protein LSAT2_018950 [Lamellibrachia satsuma]